jgi:ATP-binding cassette, subfamily B, multidrug efflux pump
MLGTVSSFSLYLLQLLFPMGAIGWLFSLIQQAKASAERLLSVMAVEPAIAHPAVSPFPTRPAYRWESLGYRYSDEGPWVFRGLYGEVREGQHIGVSAPLGGGKTTLARLLVRQMAPTEGQVWLGDLPLQTYTISCETYSILYLCPHPKLSRYGTTIEDSLEASSRRVLPALQAGGR